MSAGRKRRADVWTYFSFDAVTNKTMCKPCGATISGKNRTNLKQHLQTRHPDLHAKVTLLCLQLLVIHSNPSLGTKRGKFPQINIFKKPSKTKTNLDTKSKDSILKNSKEPTKFNPGGYPQQPGRPGGYPYQAGYPNQGVYPAPGSPYSGGYGGYPGGYINHNPNNKVLSPHYAGSFGYGGYAAGGGSPFSNFAKAQGFVPSDKSRGFGHKAAMAAAGGALAGMALGYGLGRFPRPHFHFHNPQEEYFYYHYMYRKYGVRSTDTNDFSRDYKYIHADGTFDSFMKSCMNRTDLLPVLRTAANDDDDETVSIVEIGYPALITQMKLKRCIELYTVNAERDLKKKVELTASSGVQRLETGLRGLLSVVISITVMLSSSLLSPTI
uniref:BED-type domain-containing protein n=1 Tax=Amphilophus citrinellus TaxID=61819 RepID=A0A3Q0RBP7_AMPCI